MNAFRFAAALIVAFVSTLATSGVQSISQSAYAQPVAPITPPDTVLDPGYTPDRVRDGYLTTISEIQLDTATGEQLVIETVNVSDGGDPVLHLLDQSGEQLVMDDNGAGDVAARINYTSPGGRLTLVVRSRIMAAAGTADLLLNGELWREKVAFGGWHLAYDDLRQGEQLQSVHLPNGASGGHRLYVLDTAAEGIDYRAAGGGPWGAALFDVPIDLGRRTVFVSARMPSQEGPARMIRNDLGMPGRDPDTDGLGSGLEATLGACETLTGYATGMDGVEFDCSLAADPRDTDGDGLRDDWETLGLTRSYLTGPQQRRHESLPLPMWGADPRHKDLFIEVDFMQRMPNEMAIMLPAANAQQFASYYQDELDDPSPLINAYRAATLRNPDGKRGINVHLDTGRAPMIPEDATTYGDWGGYTVVPPVQNGDGSFSGVDYKTAWMNNMSPARRGIFRYTVAYASGGGQVQTNSFATTGPMSDAWVLAHEFGHGMGLGHSGPSYATGDVDPNCKPNYQSMMNYAFQGTATGFSDGVGAPPINNAVLREWQAVSPENTVYLDVLENVFEYWVDREHGHVDWNRDGEFAPEGTTVQAYANFKRGGGGCEFTRYHRDLIPNAASTTAPAMARLGDRLYVFYSVLGALYYTYSTDAGDCPVLSTAPCASWTQPELAYMDAQGGVDAVRVGQGASAKLLIVTIDHDGNVWQNLLDVDSQGNEVWAQAGLIPGTSPAAGEPSLSDLGYCKIFLSYRGADNLVRFNRLSCADNFRSWQGEQLALDQDGNPLEMAEYASPGIGRAYLDQPGRAELYGAFADVDGMLDLYQFNESSSRWELTNLMETRPGPIEGRPALVWVSSHTEIDYPGRLYLLFIDHDPGPSFRNQERTVRMMMSFVDVEEDASGNLTKTLRVGLYAPFDNVWLYAFGVDLLFEAGRDTNMRAVLSLAGNNDDFTKLQFRPKADGIADFVMTDFNDWETMRVRLCQNVVNPGNLLDEPAGTCPTS